MEEPEPVLVKDTGLFVEPEMPKNAKKEKEVVFKTKKVKFTNTFFFRIYFLLLCLLAKIAIFKNF